MVVKKIHKNIQSTMTHTKNNIPIYKEQQFLNEEQQTIQKILNDFKQPIPSNYIKLKVEEGNYMGSPKWKDRLNYERYGFYLEEEKEKWVQIDIPHNLVEKLEIVKGDDITYPFYLTIDISQKKLIRGAYTIENEEEVFINKPVSEKNVEKELVKRLKELEELRKKVKGFEDLQSEKAKLEEKSRNLENKIQDEQGKNDRLDKQIWRGIKVKEELQKELKELKNEPKKKRSWADFYEWLQTNITKDRNVKAQQLIIKNELITEYPLLSQFVYGSANTKITYYGMFLEILRRTFTYGSSDFDVQTHINAYLDFGDYCLKTYDDEKKIFREFLIENRNGNWFPEIDKLLNKYRQETLLQTATLNK